MTQSGGKRPIAVITGANGGMGRACARTFGETMDLVLTDIAADPLGRFAETLADEGYSVAATIAGGLDDESVLAALSDAAPDQPVGVLIHTAGLSPILAAWEPIMALNLVATEKLLQAIEPRIGAGTVGVLIASMAGHMAPADPDIDTILDDPLDPEFITRITPVIARLADPASAFGPAGVSYGLSKRGVIRLCERKAAGWAKRGARIASISPGTIWTPMGRREADGNPAAAAVVHATPLGRWGTVMDIAAAARFVASDAAGFFTGCDLRVDGGVTAALRFGG